MRFKETFKTKINPPPKKNNEQTDQLGELVGRLRGPPGIPGRGRPGPPGLPGLQGVTGWQQMLFFAIETRCLLRTRQIRNFRMKLHADPAA